MKRTYVSLILPFFCQLLVSCASFDAGNGNALYTDKKASEAFVYFVQVPASASGQDLSDAIIEQAARQIFIRNKVTARYIVAGDGDNATNRKTSGQVSFDQGNIYQLSGQLEILDTVKTANVIQALVRNRDSGTFKNVKLPTIKSIGKNGNPDWVTNPPSGLSFFASVEASSARSGASDGFQNSDTMAIASLSRFISKEYVSGTGKLYEATFSGAYIARRWYNKSTNTYYSLAVIPRNLAHPVK
jgi:hypothetical protein